MYLVYPQFIWTILVPTSGVRTRRRMINFPFVRNLTAIPKFNNGHPPGFRYAKARWYYFKKIPGKKLNCWSLLHPPVGFTGGPEWGWCFMYDINEPLIEFFRSTWSGLFDLHKQRWKGAETTRNHVKYALNFGVDYCEFEILLRVPQRSIIKSQK